MNRSIFRRTFEFIILAIFLIIVLFVVSEYYTITHFNQQIRKTYKNSIDYSVNYWSNQLYMANREIRDYFVSGGAKDLDIIRDTAISEEDPAYSESTGRIKESLTGFSTINGNSISFFVYVKERDLLISSVTGSQYPVGEKRDVLKTKIEDDNANEVAIWRQIKIGDAFYFLHVINDNGVCYGCFISAADLLDAIMPKENAGSIAIADMNDQIIYQQGSVQSKTRNRSDAAINMLYSRPMQFINKKIVVRYPYTSVFSSGGAAVIIIVIAMGATVLFIIVGLYAQNRVIFRPLNGLKEAMEQFSRGNMDVRLHEAPTNKDINVLYETFNHMTEQITNLKIDAYEAKLEREQVYAHYLRTQIHSHFYINILNLIYNLAGVHDDTSVQELSRYTSGYLRFLLAKKDDFVEIKDELQCVRQYIGIQNVRYQDNFRITVDCPEQAKNKKIPPLLIQTFVENSIKHNIMLVEKLDITVTIRDKEEVICIKIRDNGLGFPQGIIEKLDNDMEIEKDGEHIGIVTIKNRIRLLYGGKGSIHIANLKTGSEISIAVPEEIE